MSAENTPASPPSPAAAPCPNCHHAAHREVCATSGCRCLPASPIQFREFDAERIQREIEEGAPALKASVEAYERAKHVSQRTMQMEIGAPIEKDWKAECERLRPDAEAWNALRTTVTSWAVSHPRKSGDAWHFGFDVQLTDEQVRDAVSRGGLGWAPLDEAVRNLATALSAETNL